MDRTTAISLATQWAERAERAHESAQLAGAQARKYTGARATAAAADATDRYDQAVADQGNAIRMATMWTNLAALLPDATTQPAS